ncbi:MAG: hypothetical protein HY981_01620, partial [Candidatus Magasanikbacteria bacterium]|nr:hypothetical protein [Candidatus Magasanikbacteria bacterium]
MKKNFGKKCLKTQGLVLSLCILVLILLPSTSARAYFLADNSKVFGGFLKSVETKINDGWSTIHNSLKTDSKDDLKQIAKQEDTSVESLLVAETPNESQKNTTLRKESKANSSVSVGFGNLIKRKAGLLGESVKNTFIFSKKVVLTALNSVQNGMEFVGNGSVQTIQGLFKPTFDILKKNPVENLSAGLTNFDVTKVTKKVVKTVQNFKNIANFRENSIDVTSNEAENKAVANSQKDVKIEKNGAISGELVVAQNVLKTAKIREISNKLNVSGEAAGRVSHTEVSVQANQTTLDKSGNPFSAEGSQKNTTALPSTLSLSDLKVTGIVDFTGAQVKGFQQVINNILGGGTSPNIVFYNS